MKNRTPGFAIVGALVLLNVAWPQEPVRPLPEFEVASVKLTQHGRTADGWSHSSLDIPSPGNFVATNVSLKECIQYAYQVKADQISGPDWLNSAGVSYDIVAKTPAETRAPQVQLMLQSLLAERFKLAFHRESRIVPVYLLVTNKNGPKLHEVVPSGEPRLVSKGGHIDSRSVSMAQFADQLSRELGRPVIDETGIEGTFDVSLEHSVDNNDTTARPSIFTAIQQQLGLKLQASKGPVEILIIDHAEKIPTEN